MAAAKPDATRSQQAANLEQIKDLSDIGIDAMRDGTLDIARADSLLRAIRSLAGTPPKGAR